MGFLDGVEHTADGVAKGVEHTAGRAVDDAANAAGSILDAVGAHGASRAVDKWGDRTADDLGVTVAEKQLGETTDPAELIHGDVAALTSATGRLRKFAGAFGQAAQGLSAVDTAHWSGSAADAFRAKYAPHPQKWSNAQAACTKAAGSLDSHAQTVSWAQGQARDAITLYERGRAATVHAVATYQAQVASYNTAADTYNAAVAGGLNPGPVPVKPAPFTDPGAADRRQAQTTLTQARRRRDATAEQAASAVKAATALAPTEPSLGSRLLDDASDVAQGSQLAGVHFAGGIVKGTLGIGNFARTLNPLDQYNLAHPAAYLDGLSSTAAGLLHAGDHPVDLVKGLVGTGWSSDPAEALGNLVPNVVLAVTTDGSGTAADTGASIAERAAVDSAERDAAETGVRDAAGDPLDNAREPGDMTCEGDPIDVASGNMVLPQVDVELAGMLPLLVRRTHISAYRLGRWFGPSWASTLDQQLTVDAFGVIYTAPDGVVLFYPHPAAEPVLPEQGAQWPLTRNGDGYSITDPAAGQTLHFTERTGSAWPISAVTDRAGHRISFRYAADGTPAEIAHDGAYRIRIDTAQGRVGALYLVGAGDDGTDIELVRYGYTDGHLADVTNSSGRSLRFRYDSAGRIIEWIDRNESWYRYTYDAAGRCVHTEGAGGFLTGDFAYDRDAMVTVHTDALGAVSRFELDERLRVTAETDPLGNITRSQWDDHGRLLARADPLGATTRYTYDEVGNPLTVTRPDGTRAVVVYNDANLPTVAMEPDGATWRYGYDEHGNRVTETDPAGAITRYEYDGHGHLTTVTDPLGAVTRIDTNPAGLPVMVATPGGGVTRYDRDGFGRVTAITDPAGGVIRLGWTVEGDVAWSTSPTGATERWTYDGEGNPVEHADASGAVTRTEYTHFDLPAAETGPDGARLEFSYDPELRLTAVTNPQGLTWRYTYDLAGRLISETDFNDRVLAYSHDAAGRLVSRTNGSGQTTRYTRDAVGNVTQQRSGEQATGFDYDRAGRMVRATSPDAELVYQRDALGQVIAETCNDRTLSTGYDPLGRTIWRRTPSGVESAWTYDHAGRPAVLRTAGQILRFTHDAAGRETHRHIGSATVLTQQWDGDHRLSSQTLWAPAHPTTAGAADPRPSSLARLIQHRAYSFTPDGRLGLVEDERTGPRRFELDRAGRVTAVHGHGWTERYTYDPAGNLTEATAPSSSDQGHREYSGTLIRRAGRHTYEHDDQGRVVVHRRRTLSGKTRVWRYIWDADDRLVAVSTPSGAQWTYHYDALGRRVAKRRHTADGSAVAEQIDFTWNGPVLVEQAHTTWQPTGPETRTTTWDHQPGSFTPITQTGQGQLPQAPRQWTDRQFCAIVTDLVGTPTELVDTAGDIVWQHVPTLWGTGQPHGRDGADCPLRFPGQYHDPETGLNYNLHRYYDPTTARYQTPDPLGLIPQPNPHTYVPNPTTWTDPLGLAPCPSGLKNASDGLRSLFSDGSVRGRPIISIRSQLLDSGFTQGLTRNRSGYLFTNQLGEQVRIMSRGGHWDMRIMNQFGNNLDEYGNVASRKSSHDINIYSK